MFSQDVIEAAKLHAIAEYPKEACGLVVDDTYVPLVNVHETPETGFRISDDDMATYADTMQAVFHSHPDGPEYPSQSDMEHQRSSGVPWFISMVHNGIATVPFFFGDEVPVPELIGRSFRHGVTDCYAFIRDYYRVEKDILLPDFPRNYEWWYEGQNLYEENFAMAGFSEVVEPEVGDVFLAQIHSTVLNHGGIYLGEGLIAHHLVGRLSRREPALPWKRFIRKWLRYTKE